MELQVKRACLALVLAAAAFSAGADQVYRWVDKDGHVHYSQTPPAASIVGAEKLDMTAPPPDPGSSVNQMDNAQFVQQNNQREQAEQKKAKQDEQKNAQQKALCDALRSKLLLMQQGGRMFTMDAQGNRQYLDDSKRAQEEQQLQDQIAQNCAG